MARSRYFERFPVVEVQQTFYRPPRPETLARWREEAPEASEFTLKAWQLITHEPTSPTYRRLREPVPEPQRSRYGSFRPTGEVRAAWLETLEAALALRARTVVFQCPASFGPDAEHLDNLRRFFSAARRDAPDITFGWEPRGHWPDRTVSELCRELGLLLVVDPFRRSPAADGPSYFRLHGLSGYRHRYSDAELRQLLEWCGPGAKRCRHQHAGHRRAAVGAGGRSGAVCFDGATRHCNAVTVTATRRTASCDSHPATPRRPTAR
jgi:uncharacterized protein YecE (DUF72 family)